VIRWRWWQGVGRGFSRTLGDTAVALTIALAISGTTLAAAGYPPTAVWRGALGFALLTPHGLLNTFVAATPLIFSALCFLLGARGGVFNVGAEGVILVSAGITVSVGAFLRLPAGVHHSLTLIAAIAAGAAWMLPVAYLKIRREVHEVLSTVMLNWVALFLLAFLIAYPLRDLRFPARTVIIQPSAQIPPLIPGTSLTSMLGLAIVTALAFYVLLFHTRTGSHLRACGWNPEAARAMGIDVQRVVYLSLVVGGAVAGLAGFTLTAGFPPYWYIDEHMQSVQRIGFGGIVISAMSRDHPLLVIPMAVLYGALLTSRSYLQLFYNIPFEFTELVAGIVVVALAIPGLLSHVTQLLQSILLTWSNATSKTRPAPE
jgi:ABC-type uncharacterized transport system permease subunit